MTYFDRDYELRESALSCIFELLQENSELVLDSPFSTVVSSGRTVVITGIKRAGAETVQFVSSEGDIPPTRLDASSVMELIDTSIMTKAYTMK